VLAIAGFAALHAVHLRADFPNGSPWLFDWAKYTDEGWYGAAAIRAHLFGNWYLAGDLNTAVALPVWPFVEWVLFFFTGVTVEAARALAVGCFFASLALSYLLLRTTGPRWAALLGVTLAVTSPYLYSFSRLAILEPLETTLTLAMLNVAVRLPRMRRPVMGSVAVGVLFALAMLTKTNAAFLAPAVAWAIAAPLRDQRKLALKCVLTAGSAAAVGYGVWIALIARAGLIGDYEFFFLSANSYVKPPEFWWPLAAFWWSLHGMLWVDHSLVLLAAALTLGAAIAWRSGWGRRIGRDPVFGAAILGILGFVLFMTVQNHPQPRYFTVPAFFVCIVVALGVGRITEQAAWARLLGAMAVLAAATAAGVHGLKIIDYARHPQYTWVNAATELTHYIDTHPNGKRLMVSTSGDEISLMTGLPAICDELTTDDLAKRVGRLDPGWFSSWNGVDPSVLADLHTRYSLEQVASFSALDDPERDVLVLFKLHPLPDGKVRDEADPGLSDVLPGDRIDVPVE
jgi:4-amino-4-deoxy-L-arabinose transferase-like glycosyltransferase